MSRLAKLGGGVTLFPLAVLFGIAWLLGGLHIVHVSVEAVVALALMLLGAALIVTGRTDWSLSRRSWPIWLGIGLISVLVLTSSTAGVAGALQDVSFGNTDVTAAPGTSTVHGGFGNLRVDASGFATGTLTVKSIAGETVVTGAGTGGAIPPNFTVDAHVVAGRICVDGQRVADGVGASWRRPATSNATTPTGGASPATGATIDVHQVFGQIQVGSPGCTP